MVTQEIRIGNVMYPIEDEDDMISLAHLLARQGKDVKEIADILGISVRKAKKYLSDCW